MCVYIYIFDCVTTNIILVSVLAIYFHECVRALRIFSWYFLIICPSVCTWKLCRGVSGVCKLGHACCLKYRTNWCLLY